MDKIKLIYLKNQMLVANSMANFLGVLLVKTLMLRIQEAFATEILDYPAAHWAGVFFSPFAFFFVTVMTLVYEKPIRRYLNAQFRRTSIPQDLKLKARQRLLNEPFVLIALDFSMWLLAAIVWSAIHWAYDSGIQLVQDSLYGNLTTGLITVTVAFFLLEHLLQKRLAPLNKKSVWLSEMFPDMGFRRLCSWPPFVPLCGSGHLCRAARPKSFPM